MNAPFNIAEQRKQEVEAVAGRVTQWPIKRQCDLLEKIAGDLSGYDGADGLYAAIDAIRDNVAREERNMFGGEVGDMHDNLANWMGR